MRTATWIRVCGAYAVLLSVQAFWVNLNYLLRAANKTPLGLGSAWVVMVWCAGLAAAGIALLLLRPGARTPVAILLGIYVAYWAVPLVGGAIIRFQPFLLIPALLYTALPAACLWYLSRHQVKETLSARLA